MAAQTISAFEGTIVNSDLEGSQKFGDYIKIWFARVLDNYPLVFKYGSKEYEDLSLEGMLIHSRLNNIHEFYNITQNISNYKIPQRRKYLMRKYNFSISKFRCKDSEHYKKDSNFNFKKSIKDFHHQFKVFVEAFKNQPDTFVCYENYTKSEDYVKHLEYIIVKKHYVAYIKFFVGKEEEDSIDMILSYIPYIDEFDFNNIYDYFSSISQTNWKSKCFEHKLQKQVLLQESKKQSSYLFAFDKDIIKTIIMPYLKKGKLSLTEIIQVVNAYAQSSDVISVSSESAASVYYYNSDRSSSARSSSARSSSARSSSARSSSARSSSARSSSARSSSGRSSSAKSSSGRSSSDRSSSARSSSDKESSSARSSSDKESSARAKSARAKSSKAKSVRVKFARAKSTRYSKN
jgi:hypothetical protein